MKSSIISWIAAWWKVCLGLALAAWGGLSLYAPVTGTVRIVASQTGSLTHAELFVQEEKGPRQGENFMIRMVPHEWDQIIDFNIHLPKVWAIQLRIGGEDASGTVKSVSLLDEKGTVLWTAPDPTEARWRLGKGFTMASPRLTLPWWPAIVVCVLGLLLILWQIVVAIKAAVRCHVSPLPYAIAVAFVFLSCAFLYAKGIEAGRGASLPNEGWVGDIMLKKMAAVHSAPGQRTFIVGGSSGLYGVEAGYLSKEAGVPVINLAAHAGLPLNFHLGHARNVWRRGDTVILHLEYYYWDNDEKITNWKVDQALSWGSHGSSTRYFTYSKIDLLKNVPPDRVLAGWIARLNPKSFWNSSAIHVLLPEGGDDWTTKNTSIVVDAHGDLVSSPSVPIKVTPVPVTAVPVDEHSAGKTLLASFLKDAQDAGVRVFFAFTPTIQDPLVDFRSPHMKAWADQQIAWLSAHGAVPLGRPEDMQHPLSLFLDTPNHLTKEGRVLNTQTLLRLLRERGWPKATTAPAR